jgi:hypothetical protein
VPEAEGASLRTLGLVVGSAEGVQALRESVAVLEHAEGRLEHARSLLELGAALRRGGVRTEARNVLRAALDESARLGERTRRSRAWGARRGRRAATPRSADALRTGVADGQRGPDRRARGRRSVNREIAQRQFVTVKAIEWHLRNVYRKLDIASREELPTALAWGPEAAIVG